MEEDEDGVLVLRRGTAQEVDYGNYEAGPETPWFVLDCVPQEISQSAPSLLLQGQDIIQQILEQKVVQADSDTRGPPYDSLQTYAYEGRGSLTGSVSSLGLTGAMPELNYAFLEEWESDGQRLEHMVGEQLGTDPPNTD
ncbi:hypothetical protein CesoFtcFv8_014478 [Champsocephalus esox]|nr:hypothetical protein CesoFtcFv8_014478 [Champsocephalus esox]